MQFEFYRWLHLIGIFCVILPIGGMLLHVLNGGSRNFPFRKVLFMTHGMGMLIVLVAGFGMIARLGLVWSENLWLIVKLAVWLFYGVVMTLALKKPQNARAYWFICLLAFMVASYLAIQKPF